MDSVAWRIALIPWLAWQRVPTQELMERTQTNHFLQNQGEDLKKINYAEIYQWQSQASMSLWVSVAKQIRSIETCIRSFGNMCPKPEILVYPVLSAYHMEESALAWLKLTLKLNLY